MQLIPLQGLSREELEEDLRDSSQLVDHLDLGFLGQCFQKILRCQRRRYLILKINYFSCGINFLSDLAFWQYLWILCFIIFQLFISPQPV
ncbi:hypothetical protein CsSME_00025439 [Camellia sinensis var. sinensis]